jgi:hypothetical protein
MESAMPQGGMNWTEDAINEGACCPVWLGVAISFSVLYPIVAPFLIRGNPRLRNPPVSISPLRHWADITMAEKTSSWLFERRIYGSETKH